MHRASPALFLLLALAACGRTLAPDDRIGALEARVAKLEGTLKTAGSDRQPDRLPHTLLISWADTPGTVTRAYPDKASCEAAKASLLEENRKTSESIPANSQLNAPPHLARPTCMAG